MNNLIPFRRNVPTTWSPAQITSAIPLALYAAIDEYERLYGQCSVGLVAQWCGVDERTVYRWLDGTRTAQTWRFACRPEFGELFSRCLQDEVRRQAFQERKAA